MGNGRQQRSNRVVSNKAVTGTQLALLALLAAGPLASACNTQSAQASDQASAAPCGRKLAKPTPAVIAAGEKILTKNPDAPVGSEHPFVVDGKRFIGRIEEHDNPTNEPGRPPGKHKGVTVYEP